jgi:hypothetical protein
LASGHFGSVSDDGDESGPKVAETIDDVDDDVGERMFPSFDDPEELYVDKFDFSTVSRKLIHSLTQPQLK